MKKILIWLGVIMILYNTYTPKAFGGCEDVAIGMVIGVSSLVFGGLIAHEVCHHQNHPHGCSCNCRECGKVYLSDEPRYTPTNPCGRQWHNAWTERVYVPAQYNGCGQSVPEHEVLVYHPGHYE